MASKYYPVCVSLEGRRILIVGGGNVALRKIENLMDYESDITVVSPEVHDKIEYFAERNVVKLEKREYESPEAKNYGLVISASDSIEVNQKVYDDCEEANILVNVVDNPPLCTFIVPAVVKRNHLTVSVSTDGKAPFLAGYLRLILEDIFPKHWSKIVGYAHSLREKANTKYRGQSKKRSECFTNFLSADWKTLIKEKSEQEIEEELEKMLE